MMRIGIILGSTRPGRIGEAVAKWVYKIARKVATPNSSSWTSKTSTCRLLDEPRPPSLGHYTKQHTKAWAAKIDSFDA